jgi:hypothetical protein
MKLIEYFIHISQKNCFISLLWLIINHVGFFIVDPYKISTELNKLDEKVYNNMASCHLSL